MKPWIALASTVLAASLAAAGPMRSHGKPASAREVRLVSQTRSIVLDGPYGHRPIDTRPPSG